LQQTINTILVPVLLDNDYLPVLKQASELAKEHNACVHLLLMPEIRWKKNHSILFGIFPFLSTREISEMDAYLLANWKQFLHTNYDIEVKCAMNWGSWKKGVIKYAKNIRADMIVLKDSLEHQNVIRFGKSPIEYIIEQSPCQVITIFSKRECLSEWQQIVIPVTDFVPERRIRTIIKVARVFNLKIHLIAFGNDADKKTTSSFYFLTETLKLLKNAGNIQVECSYLSSTAKPAFNFLNFTRTHHGDALLTNRANHDLSVVYSTVREEKKNVISDLIYPSLQ